jgi:alpha-tubulin suppressor-like RCC1 family protein
MVSLGLAAGFVTVGTSTAAAASPSPVPKAPVVSDASSAADVGRAQAIAKKFGHKVVVTGTESSTSLTSALPSGAMQLTEDAVPVRARVSGDWKPIDLTLVSSGGWWTPSVSTQPVEFSAGGGGPMARVQDGSGAWIAEDAPFGVLPKPSVKGPTATYSSVLPAVDLVLTATATGMSEVLVVKSAAAAANPALSAVEFRISGSTVTTDASGVAHAGASGKAGLVAAPSMWWDSSQGSTAAGPGGTLMPQPVTQTVTADGVTVDVAAAAQTAGVTYPVFVDPPWSAGQWSYWYIDQAYPTQSYLNGQYASGVQRVGYVDAAHSPQDGRTHRARAYWTFNTSGLAGKQIQAAQFSASLNGAYNCSIMHSSYLGTSSAPVGGTWNSESGYGASVIDTRTPSGCGAVVGFNAINAAYGGTTELEILSTDESNNTGWQKWNQGATLSVTYNSRPNTPTALAFASPSRACSTDQSQPTYLDGNQSITVTANATDPDSAQTLATTIAVHGVTDSSYSWSTTTTSQAQGTTAPVALPTGLSNGEYSWTAQSSDGSWGSLVSATCYFQVESDPPDLPTVTRTSSGTPEVGKAMTVEIDSTATDSVQLFAVWWVDGNQTGASTPPVTNPITIGGSMPACNTYDRGVHYVCPDAGSASLTVAPIDRTSTLMVASYDHTGRISVAGGSSARAFQVTATIDTVGVSYNGGHLWDTTGYPTMATTVLDQDTSTASTGTTAPQTLIGGQLVTASFQQSDTTVLQLTPGSSSPAVVAAHTASSPTNPARSYTISFWVNPASGATGHLLSQAARFDWWVPQTWGTLLDFNLTASGLQFCVSPTASATCTAPTAVQPGQWTLVTGIWDDINKQARILIGDGPQPAATNSAAARDAIIGAGPLATGLVTTDTTGAYTGSISTANAQIFQPASFPGVISHQQIDTLYSQGGGPNGEQNETVSSSTISNGTETACSVVVERAYCWGHNESGEIGDGTVIDSAVPVPVDTSGALAGKAVTDISTDHETTCAVAQGRAYCWGSNAYGLLGDGSTTDSTTPVAVSTTGALYGRTVTSISVGHFMVCAVADGNAYCWGQGPLGDGSESSSFVPVAVYDEGALSDGAVSAISVGNFGACVIAGSIYCWGYNSYGSLGDGSYTDSLTPTVGGFGRSPLGTFTALSVKGFSACVVEDGEPYCWGDNSNGQLGNGFAWSDSNSPVEVDVSGVLSGATVTAVSVGDSHTCAVADGATYCWGDNAEGELGNGLSGSGSDVPLAVDMSGAMNGLTASSVGALESSTCAIADNTPFCWGSNTYGQLGDGTTTDSDTPVAVSSSAS